MGSRVYFLSNKITICDLAPPALPVLIYQQQVPLFPPRCCMQKVPSTVD